MFIPYSYWTSNSVERFVLGIEHVHKLLTAFNETIRMTSPHLR